MINEHQHLTFFHTKVLHLGILKQRYEHYSTIKILDPKVKN